MSKGYFTVANETENLIIIERSKFICVVKPVIDEQDAKEFIEGVRKKHSLATHNCYAYIADENGLVQKFSDDGEPQGTAGLPMLEVLKNKKIFKTATVVTRYFGGIKLGTGGLTRAYGGSVSECLSKAKILNMQEAVIIEIEKDYEGYSKLLKVLSDDNISIINTDFQNTVTVRLAVKSDYFEIFNDKLVDYFNGKISINFIENKYYSFR